MLMIEAKGLAPLQQVLHQQNPYVNSHILTCLSNHGLRFWQTTPKRAGVFWNFATYPTPIQPQEGVGSQAFENLEWHTYARDLAREQHDPRYVPAEFESRFNYPAGALLLALASWVLGLRDLVVLYIGGAVMGPVASWLTRPRATGRPG